MNTKFLYILFVYIISQTLNSQTFSLKSKTVSGQFTQEQFSNQFGCKGKNISPQLYWENPPEGTESFAITLYDEDAPTGSGFWHWIVYNIPSYLSEIDENMKSYEKNIALAENDLGKKNYSGVCPPKGTTHKYVFTIHALKTKITDGDSMTNALLRFVINSNTLEKASIVIYGSNTTP